MSDSVHEKCVQVNWGDSPEKTKKCFDDKQGATRSESREIRPLLGGQLDEKKTNNNNRRPV
jgi:hypothetical protein